MAAAENVVRNMLDAVLRGDGDAAMACIHPDIVVIEPASLAYGGVFHGRSAFQQDVFGVILGKLSIQIGRCEIMGSDTKVAASMDITFTSRKTGLSLMMPYVEVYTIKDDMIIHLDVYPQDTKRLSTFWDAN